MACLFTTLSLSSTTEWSRLYECDRRVVNQ